MQEAEVTCCTPTGKKVDLGVASFGVSVTTMEEVFIKVGEDSGESLDNRWVGRGEEMWGGPRQMVGGRHVHCGNHHSILSMSTS